MSIEIGKNVLNGVESVCKSAVLVALEQLAEKEKLGCSVSEAMEMLNLSLKKGKKKGSVTKTVKNKPSIPLPFCGTYERDNCMGIRLNHGLHTQCLNAPDRLGDYCKTCQKQVDKNASGKPTYGDIRDRLECPILEYRDPKGRLTIPYGNVMEKLGLDRTAVEAEAEKFGLVIPEKHWQVVKKTRGRPKKSVTGVSDTSSETSAPKKRGRPKKVKVVESAVGDDLLAQLKAADDSSVVSDSGSELSTEDKKAAKAAEREAKKAEKARQATELKAMKLAEREQKKAEKLAAKEAEKAAKKAERDAKKAEKLAAKEAEKAAKKAERDAKKAEKKETKKTTKVMAPALKITQEEFDAIDELEMEKEEVYEKNFQDAVERYQQSKHKEIDEEQDGEPVSVSLPTSPVPETGDDDDDTMAVIQFTHEGKTYLRTQDNQVFTEDALESDDADPIGVWNPDTNTIDEALFLSDDEEEDDDEDDEDDE